MSEMKIVEDGDVIALIRYSALLIILLRGEPDLLGALTTVVLTAATTLGGNP